LWTQQNLERTKKLRGTAPKCPLIWAWVTASFFLICSGTIPSQYNLTKTFVLSRTFRLCKVPFDAALFCDKHLRHVCQAFFIEGQI